MRMLQLLVPISRKLEKLAKLSKEIFYPLEFFCETMRAALEARSVYSSISSTLSTTHVRASLTGTVAFVVTLSMALARVS